MHNNIPKIRHASLYARTGNKNLLQEIIRVEGINSCRMGGVRY